MEEKIPEYVIANYKIAEVALPIEKEPKIGDINIASIKEGFPLEIRFLRQEGNKGIYGLFTLREALAGVTKLKEII